MSFSLFDFLGMYFRTNSKNTNSKEIKCDKATKTHIPLIILSNTTKRIVQEKLSQWVSLNDVNSDVRNIAYATKKIMSLL